MGATEPSRRQPEKVATFSVDAALLRELGEHLIGRPYIALAELVKNAYDADAVLCEIQIGKDTIVVSDDGHGMPENEFLEHWMRIGTTHKVDKRRSKTLGRSMTGSKGLGRLSVQFLADEMELWSTSEDDPAKTLYAVVDWNQIRSGQDISTVNVLWDVQQEAPGYPGDRGTGTRIELKGLKSEWGTEAIDALGKEVWVLRSPFRRAKGRPEGRTAQDFYVDVDAPNIEDAEPAFDRFRDCVVRELEGSNSRLAPRRPHRRRGGCVGGVQARVSRQRGRSGSVRRDRSPPRFEKEGSLFIDA